MPEWERKRGGYASSIPPERIERVRPLMVFLSEATGEWEGRPDPERQEAWKGYTLLRTRLNRWVEVTTDGDGIWGEAARREERR